MTRAVKLRKFYWGLFSIGTGASLFFLLACSRDNWTDAAYWLAELWIWPVATILAMVAFQARHQVSTFGYTFVG